MKNDPPTQGLQRHDGWPQDCGRVTRYRVDWMQRTLYLETQTHGMTLVWSGQNHDGDLPRAGDHVTLNWGDTVMIEGANGPRWFPVRSRVTESLESTEDRVKHALIVGISAALWGFMFFAGAVFASQLRDYLRGERAWEWIAPEAMLFTAALWVLLAWRMAIKVRAQRAAIGVRKRPSADGARA